MTTAVPDWCFFLREERERSDIITIETVRSQSSPIRTSCQVEPCVIRTSCQVEPCVQFCVITSGLNRALARFLVKNPPEKIARNKYLSSSSTKENFESSLHILAFLRNFLQASKSYSKKSNLTIYPLFWPKSLYWSHFTAIFNIFDISFFIPSTEKWLGNNCAQLMTTGNTLSSQPLTKHCISIRERA